jgi:hypothetical protein
MTDTVELCQQVFKPFCKGKQLRVLLLLEEEARLGFCFLKALVNGAGLGGTDGAVILHLSKGVYGLKIRILKDPITES